MLSWVTVVPTLVSGRALIPSLKAPLHFFGLQIELTITEATIFTIRSITSLNELGEADASQGKWTLFISHYIYSVACRA